LEIQKIMCEEDKNAHSNSIVATVGYNIASFPPPFVRKSQLTNGLPEGLLLVRKKYFSVNYADICIRWGLYESAFQYVGWPIVPGFDFSGVVENSSSPDFQVGDNVFGFTMFGAYSSRLLVPSTQVRRLPVFDNGESQKVLALNKPLHCQQWQPQHSIRYRLLVVGQTKSSLQTKRHWFTVPLEGWAVCYYKC